MRGIEATLYSMSISHPARAAGLMLRHKGIEAGRGLDIALLPEWVPG